MRGGQRKTKRKKTKKNQRKKKKIVKRKPLTDREDRKRYKSDIFSMI